MEAPLVASRESINAPLLHMSPITPMEKGSDFTPSR